MQLERTYGMVRDILGPERAECLEAALEVERIRSIWRPTRVRLILLAESHVWTSLAETRSCVLQPDGVETGFVRFVYCLGGGEPQLVTPPISPNPGTSQFWKLFHDTVYGPDSSYRPVTKKGEPNAACRVENKLELLKKMRDSGIWLVDASISALYRASQPLAQGKAYKAVLQVCWESYVADAVCGAAASRVAIIGKQVDSAIGSLVRRDLGINVQVDVLKQPNARMSSEEIVLYRRQCFDLGCMR
jgi:hypothetical protein